MNDSGPDLFGSNESGVGGEEGGAGAPLADRMRPRSLEEIAGQRHLVGEGGVLETIIRTGKPVSLIFWGPPGTGKTTLARLIARYTGAVFLEFSAVLSGVKEIRAAVARAGAEKRSGGRETILFVDEIHRFNKAQQDAFLPHMENGTIHLIGATTENPSFEVNAALLSRTRVFTLEPIAPADVGVIVDRALADRERGLGGGGATLDADAREWLIVQAGGDGRRALSLLELAAALVADGDDPGKVTLEVIRQAAQSRTLLYDKSGEEHFNLISALHKSIRGSDPDASLYWVSRMLESGEDPKYLLRRLIRIAVEDVGLADPKALSVALDCAEAYRTLGSPEGDLAIAQAVVYLAVTPKSISLYKAFDAARRDAREKEAGPVPLHLRNAPTRLMKDLGYGKDYAYPPTDQAGADGQHYFPEGLEGSRYYEPSPNGIEKRIKEYLEKRRGGEDKSPDR